MRGSLITERLREEMERRGRRRMDGTATTPLLTLCQGTTSTDREERLRGSCSGC